MEDDLDKYFVLNCVIEDFPRLGFVETKPIIGHKIPWKLRFERTGDYLGAWLFCLKPKSEKKSEEWSITVETQFSFLTTLGNRMFVPKNNRKFTGASGYGTSNLIKFETAELLFLNFNNSVCVDCAITVKASTGFVALPRGITDKSAFTGITDNTVPMKQKFPENSGIFDEFSAALKEVKESVMMKDEKIDIPDDINCIVCGTQMIPSFEKNFLFGCKKKGCGTKLTATYFANLKKNAKLEKKEPEIEPEFNHSPEKAVLKPAEQQKNQTIEEKEPEFNYHQPLIAQKPLLTANLLPFPTNFYRKIDPKKEETSEMGPSTSSAHITKTNGLKVLNLPPSLTTQRRKVKLYGITYSIPEEAECLECSKSMKLERKVRTEGNSIQKYLSYSCQTCSAELDVKEIIEETDTKKPPPPKTKPKPGKTTYWLYKNHYAALKEARRVQELEEEAAKKKNLEDVDVKLEDVEVKQEDVDEPLKPAEPLLEPKEELDIKLEELDDWGEY